MLSAMTCGGHVLLEDVPGTAKTVLARSIARSIEGATTARIQCTGSSADGRHRPVGLRPAHAGLRVPCRADLRERRARRRGQPSHPEDAVGAARGDGRAPGDGRRCDARAAGSVPAARDREPDRVRRHLPAARGPARPLLPQDRARLSRGRGRADDPRRPAHRPSAREPRAGREPRGHRRAPRCRPGRLRRRRHQALARRARARDESARRRGDGSLGAREPRPRARSGRGRSTAANTSCRSTSSSCSCP